MLLAASPAEPTTIQLSRKGPCFNKILWRDTLPRAERREVNFLCAARRHHRSKVSKQNSDGVKLGKDEFTENDSSTNRRTRDSKSVTITLDFGRVRETIVESSLKVQNAGINVYQKLSNSVDQTVEKARHSIQSLHTCVGVQNGGKVVISIQQDALFGAAKFFAFIILFLVTKQWIPSLLQKLGFGWDNDPQTKVVKDRSMGGRLISITQRRKNDNFRTFSLSSRTLNPLDSEVVDSRSEKEMKRRKGKEMKMPKTFKPPNWWPVSTETRERKSEVRGREQREVQSFLEGMLARRLTGVDFTDLDISKLYSLCELHNCSVAIPTGNTRDALYRAAVLAALSSCVSGQLSPLGIAAEKAPQFVASFARAIGLSVERASVLVNAAVAARTRATFLQALALVKQDKDSEAVAQLRDLVAVHEIFTPDRDSPEMDMVAHGLSSRFSMDDRLQLVKMYVAAGGGRTQEVAASALGITANNISNNSPSSLNA